MGWLKKPKVLLGIAVNVVYVSYYTFGGAAVGRPAAHARKAPDTGWPQVAAYYAREANQTSVYPTTDLELVVEPGRRLLLSPIYSVPGRGATPPQFVYLRFYSFTENGEYASDRLLRITADGEEVWSSTNVIYSATFGEHREVVESFGGHMPFDAFVKAGTARQVKITVGREEIELSFAQTHALRLMLRCAWGGPCG